MNVVERGTPRGAEATAEAPPVPAAADRKPKLRPLVSLLPYLARYRWQAMAYVPEPVFDQWCRALTESGHVISAKELLQLGELLAGELDAEIRRRISRGQVDPVFWHGPLESKNRTVSALVARSLPDAKSRLRRAARRPTW